LCNTESGIPIYRDTADGSRELMGINIKSKDIKDACDDSLMSFASVTRHGSWIAEQCAEFADEHADRFEVLPKNDIKCEANKVLYFKDCDADAQEVTSPGYPSLYENEQTCGWELKAPKGHQIVLVFLDVDIERSNHKRKCNHDALVWSHAGPGLNRESTEVCNSQKIMDHYLSPKESARLEFRTDGTFKGRGFKARVSCQKKETQSANSQYGNYPRGG